jgi:thymidylate synthase
VHTRLARESNPLPRLVLKRKPPTLFDYTFDDIEIADYGSHPALRAPVAV